MPASPVACAQTRLAASIPVNCGDVFGCSPAATESREPVRIQAFVAQSAIEALGISVLCGLAIEVDTSLGGLRARRVLDRIASERGLPEAIVVDNGPEFRGRALAAWSEERRVRLEFIQPGSRRKIQRRAAEVGQ